MSDKGCQAEITNFNLHSFCKEQITEFQVPMNDFFRMDVLNSLDHLVEVEAGLTVMETLTSLDQVWQWLILAQIEYHIHIQRVFKVALEEHNVLVGEYAMDLNLGLQLLDATLLCKTGLGDYFECPCLGTLLLCFNRCYSRYFISFCKTTLIQTTDTLDARIWTYFAEETTFLVRNYRVCLLVSVIDWQ